MQHTHFRRNWQRQDDNWVADAIARMGLSHAVITSVDRDDLSDGGAKHFARTIRAIRSASPLTTIEVLTPDFLKKEGALELVVEAKPDVFNHNLETVPSRYLTVRPGARYFHSIRLLQQVKELDPTMFTKSGIMVGLGEVEEEIHRKDGTPATWLSTKAPLRDKQGRVIGLIGLHDTKKPRQWLEEEVNFLESIGRQLAIGYQYTSLFTAQEQESKRTNALLQIANTLNSHSDFNEVSEAALERAAWLTARSSGPAPRRRSPPPRSGRAPRPASRASRRGSPVPERLAFPRFGEAPRVRREFWPGSARSAGG